jgi:hypothetical protein
MLSLSNHFAYRRSAIWLATCVCVFVFGWRLSLMASRYFGGPTIAGDLASILQFDQDLIPNSANTRLVFCQATKEGVGIYFCDTTGGKARLLCEQKEKGHSWKRFTMLGWSPDDSLFAVAYPDMTSDKEMILVFSGNTGEPAGKVGTDQNLEQMAWLSTNAFAYSTRTDVRVVEWQGSEDWEHKRAFVKVATNLDNFTAISSNSVAWRDAGAIWLFDLATGSPRKLWEATNKNLLEFTYSKQADEFLLNCSDAAGQYLLRRKLNETNTIDAGRIGPWWDYVRKASWTGQGTAYAYLTNDLAGSAFCIKSGEESSPVLVPWHGTVHNSTLNGNHLFFSGSPDDQAPGIWDYDLNAATFKCIVSSTSGPLKDNLGCPSTSFVLTNSLGEQRYCQVWAPAHVLPNQKHPVLLAQEPNAWLPSLQIIAARCGWYAAVVDRPFFHSWNGVYERTWIEDVTSLFEVMAHDPAIDTNRVYLLASSVNTDYLSQLMNDRPTLAKGAILFSPLGLPDPSALQNTHILITDGKLDGNATKRLSEFQDRAAEKGNDVILFFQENSAHMPGSGATECNRTRLFTKFLEQKR